MKQEAAQDSRLFLAGSNILLWSTQTPHVEADMASYLHLWVTSGVNSVQARGCLLPGSARKVSTLFLYKSYFFSRQWLISWRSGEDFCQFGAKPLTSTLWIIHVECNFASTWKSRTYKKGWMCSIFILFETTCLTIDEICAYVKGLEISEVYNDISNH